MQAKTEIELLTHLCEKDPDDQNNIGTITFDWGKVFHFVMSQLTLDLFAVRLLTHFPFENTSALYLKCYH
jgi:hypothetical protein